MCRGRAQAERLQSGFGIEAMVPDASDRHELDRIIFAELVRGIINPASKAIYLEIVKKGRATGADSVAFACTEIGLLLEPEDCLCPVYDTAKLHARAAIDFSLGHVAHVEKNS
jgi:aspartate racemase